MTDQPRPGGTQWWCPICLVTVEATLTAADTETLLVDEAHCPNAHGETPTLIGTVATERVVIVTDRLEEITR